MAVTVSGVALAGVVTVTAAGLTGSTVQLAVSYAATNGRRSYVEMQKAPVVAGAVVGFTVVAPFASGTITVKPVDSTGAVLATSAAITV